MRVDLRSEREEWILMFGLCLGVFMVSFSLGLASMLDGAFGLTRGDITFNAGVFGLLSGLGVWWANRRGVFVVWD